MEQLGAWSGTQGVQAITEAAFELMGNGREGFGCDLEVEAPTHFVWMLVGWEAIRQRESPREEKTDVHVVRMR